MSFISQSAQEARYDVAMKESAFELNSEYRPAIDQPDAIKKLMKGIFDCISDIGADWFGQDFHYS